MELLQNLVKAVSYAYRKDGACPGVLFSILKNGSAYASVVRYGSGEGFKNGKQVVVKYTDEQGNIENALSNLSDLFLEKVEAVQNPIDILRNSRKNEKERSAF